jgi:hypothetical protein
MNGRVYDYQIGRFLSVDPFIQSPLNSQSLNPYSYIMNNPLAGTDPTGYSCDAATGSHICGVDGGAEGGASTRDVTSTATGADGTKTTSHITVATTANGTANTTSHITDWSVSVTKPNGASSGQGLATQEGGASQTGTASQRPNTSPPTAPTNLILRSGTNQPRDFGSYTAEEQGILGDISSSAAIAKSETDRIANDASLPAAVRESAQRQFGEWGKSGFLAAVFDDFRLFRPDERNEPMSTRTPPDLDSVGPGDQTQFILAVNLRRVTYEYGRVMTSDTSRGYAGVSYPAGAAGITKKMMHEMRHMDPMAHFLRNGAGWQPKGPAQEHDADMWADKQWNKLDDLSR